MQQGPLGLLPTRIPASRHPSGRDHDDQPGTAHGCFQRAIHAVTFSPGDGGPSLHDGRAPLKAAIVRLGLSSEGEGQQPCSEGPGDVMPSAN